MGISTRENSASFVEDLVREFKKEVSRLGVGASSEPASVLAKRAALGIAAEGLWEDSIGPLLTSAEATQMLGGISRQALSKKANEGSVIRLRDDRNQVRYPAWQFDSTRKRVFETVPQVYSMFREADVDDWLAVSFFNTPQPELDGKAPVNVLRGDFDSEIEDAARRTCETLAH